MADESTAAVERDEDRPLTDDLNASLFESSEQAQLREEWVRVQAGFVDDPNRAVDDADALVRRVLQSVEAALEADRLLVEQRQMDADGPSTENMRTTMRAYRSFFERLLEV